MTYLESNCHLKPGHEDQCLHLGKRKDDKVSPYGTLKIRAQPILKTAAVLQMKSADRHTALHCVLAKQQEVAVRSSKAGRRRRRLLIGCARAWQQRVNSGGLRAGSAP
ncbi:hypothetical protein E5288_WYG022710 [Bos mutus]|uniref:Uncharacterized protein n=1 Tax=Bos mutus TaxID=72004 RepID=A0A6B0QXX1_9CETA|nr:hypothetical protein [Bos mutus]